MTDGVLKALVSERGGLWAMCRLRGLAKDTPERLRIAELDLLIEARKASAPPPKAKSQKRPTRPKKKPSPAAPPA